MPLKCQSCEGAGYVIQDEAPCHMTCGECAGTGNGLVAEAARGIDAALAHSRWGDRDAKKRREKIARFVASAAMPAERAEAQRGDARGA